MVSEKYLQKILEQFPKLKRKLELDAMESGFYNDWIRKHGAIPLEWLDKTR